MAVRAVVTGANSAIGRTLVACALERAEIELVAAVRSERAAAEIPAIPAGRGRIARIDYADPDSLRAACSGARALLHLPGLLVEARGSSYEQANVATTRAALGAARAAGVQKLVLLSACGADPAARNRFFRSKGEAETLVRTSGVSYTIVRCPLVLGCGSAGDRALAHQAQSALVPLLGGGRQLEQPLAGRDAARGLLAAALDPGCARDQTLELVGPECLAVRDLVQRAAALLGRKVRIVGVPLWLARSAARLTRSAVTPDVIEVLTGHVPRDPAPAARALEIELTPLDAVLRRSLCTAEAA
jgi:NADH dehydrogenase